VQNGVQQRLVDNYFPVVVDETQFSKFVHKEAHARSGCADHVSESFLVKADRGDRRASHFSIICEKQKETREPLFTWIEELVDHVCFDPAVPAQQMLYEELGEPWLVFKNSDHGGFGDRGYSAVAQSFHCGGPQGLAIKARFAEELSFLEYAYDGLFALVGCDDRLYASPLNVKNQIRGFALHANVLIFLIVRGASAPANLREKFVGIDPMRPACRLKFMHDASLEKAGTRHSQSPHYACDPGSDSSRIRSPAGKG
jgi:hypothetical protein